MPKIALTFFILELYTHLPISISADNINSLLLSLQDNMISGNVVKYLLLISSLLSLIIGTIVGLAQSKLKRLLAYSTVSHVGFLLLALLINSEKAVDSFIFYIIQYSITNLNSFLIIIAFGYIIYSVLDKAPKLDKANSLKGQTVKSSSEDNNSDIIFISQLKGQFFSNPLLTLSLAICLFSMAGVPPLIGFFSKQFVLYSAIQNGYNFMAILCIIVSVISASYYLKIVRVLFTLSLSEPSSDSATDLSGKKASSEQTLAGEAQQAENQTKINAFIGINNYHSLLISILTLLILFFIFKPSILLNVTQLLSLSLFYN